MIGTFTIEMEAEHAMVIALALGHFITDTEYMSAVAPHDADPELTHALGVAAWMRSKLTTMFYESAKRALTEMREMIPGDMLEALEEYVANYENERF